MDRKKV